MEIDILRQYFVTPPFPIGNQNLLPIQMSGTNAFYRLRFNGQ